MEEVIRELGIGEEITTSLIENLNSFIRDSVQYLVRRTKRLARELEWVFRALSGYFFYHNFVKPHWSLSVRSSKNWIVDGATPGMACGITCAPLSLYEVLTFHQL